MERRRWSRFDANMGAPNMRKVAAAVAILLSGCGSEAQRPAQPVHFNPAGNYIHQATSFVFPRLLGGFTRSGITEYNREKTDVSAGYDKVAGGQSVMATVYVYPAPPVSSIASPQAVADAAKENLVLHPSVGRHQSRHHPSTSGRSVGCARYDPVAFAGLQAAQSQSHIPVQG